MKGVHNPITRAGFAQIKKILETSMAQRKGEDLSSYVKILGTVNYDGKDCWKVEINDADYKIIDYTVAAGETSVWAIGKKLAISEYKIKELNDNEQDYSKNFNFMEVNPTMSTNQNVQQTNPNNVQPANLLGLNEIQKLIDESLETQKKTFSKQLEEASLKAKEEAKKEEIHKEITNVVLETVDKIEKTKIENKQYYSSKAKKRRDAIEDDVEPKIDLDGCHPLVAANIFRNAADMLEAMPMRPTISTLGQIIACDDEVFFLDLDDED